MLGSNNEIPLTSIVKKDLLKCPPETPLIEAVRLMQQLSCSSVVIAEGKIPLGIWTEADALNLNTADPEIFTQPISHFMSSPVKTVLGKESLFAVATRFQEEEVRHLIVVDDQGEMLGIVTQSDVIQNQGPESYLYMREVQSVVTEPVLVLPGEMHLNQAMKQFRESKMDAAIVRGFPNGEYGIITERDVVRLLAQQAIDKPLFDFANHPLKTIRSNETLLTAKDLLLEHHIRHLGVVNQDQELIGILSFSSLLRSIQYEYVKQLRSALDERDEALKQAQNNLHLAFTVLESTLEGIMVTNADLEIEMVNPAFSKITGYAADDVIGKKPNVLRSGKHDSDFYDQMWEHITLEGHWQGEIWNRRKDETLYPSWLTINVIYNKNNEIHGYAAIFSDITERKRTERQIKNLAYYDMLTKLPNRNLLMDRLKMALANAHRLNHKLALMFLDLDLFKRINDTLGHNVGDDVLKQVAMRFSNCLREGDTLGRLGGDEFVILLPELDDENEAIRVAQRASEALNKPFTIGDQQLRVTVSIGISIFPSDGQTTEALLKNADTAMYRAKELGRNHFELYSPCLNSNSLKRLKLESSLHHALDNDEFFLNYQVKVDLNDRHIAGIEALLRWNSAEGVIGPNDFIPLMEETGLIQPVGEWVLFEACEQVRRWQEMGLPATKVAVNLSTHQFCRSGIVDQVKQAIAHANIDASMLELEVTESSVMQKVDQAVVTLKEFKELGVSVAVDDFGTGFSSLSYLRDLPIDVLKIDKSFLEDLHQNTKNKAIVASIIDLAKNLDIRIVAEGVETEDQVDFLYQEGCDEVQGYLISRPVSASDVELLYQRPLLTER